uniref:Uncharacterized protein n=1 Tax=Loigolactobacillus rennini TaxID=238013 RepID=A0A1K2I4Q7_9LACO|nr:hypothetical protein LREN565_0473 [Loigolactobacillus rennini]
MTHEDLLLAIKMITHRLRYLRWLQVGLDCLLAYLIWRILVGGLSLKLFWLTITRTRVFFGAFLCGILGYSVRQTRYHYRLNGQHLVHELGQQLNQRECQIVRRFQRY